MLKGAGRRCFLDYLTYKSAFLWAHCPAEFMASVISNGGGYYATFGCISEARRVGLMQLKDLSK